MRLEILAKLIRKFRSLIRYFFILLAMSTNYTPKSKCAQLECIYGSLKYIFVNNLLFYLKI